MADGQQASSGVAITDELRQCPPIATDGFAHRLLEILGLTSSPVTSLMIEMKPGKPIAIHVSMLSSITLFNKITDEFEDGMKHFTLV